MADTTPEVREEVAGQLAGETHRVGAEEHQHAIELLLRRQRDQRQAGAAADARQQQLVVGEAQRPEPGALQVRDLRRLGDQRIDELDTFRAPRRHAIAREQVADLVLRVVQVQGHGIELVRLAQTLDQTLHSCASDPARNSSSSRSWVLRSSVIVAADRLRQLLEPRPQPLVLVFERLQHRPGAMAGRTMRLRQARRSATLRRSSR